MNGGYSVKVRVWECEKENNSGKEKVRESSELERDFVIVRGNWNFEDENKEGETENKEGKEGRGSWWKLEEEGKGRGVGGKLEILVKGKGWGGVPKISKGKGVVQMPPVFFFNLFFIFYFL